MVSISRAPCSTVRCAPHDASEIYIYASYNCKLHALCEIDTLFCYSSSFFGSNNIPPIHHCFVLSFSLVFSVFLAQPELWQKCFSVPIFYRRGGKLFRDLMFDMQIHIWKTWGGIEISICFLFEIVVIGALECFLYSLCIWLSIFFFCTSASNNSERKVTINIR